MARVQSENLEHLRGDLSNEDILRIRSSIGTCRNSAYWQGDAEAVITPERVERRGLRVVHNQTPSKLAQIWELCSGPGALSARARDTKVTHLPPIDMKYGWYTTRPNPHRARPPPCRRGLPLRRAQLCAVEQHRAWHAIRPNGRASGVGGPALRFPAMCCLLEFLMGRHFPENHCRQIS